MFRNISHLYKISLSPNISIPIISLETRSDCMNEAQKSTMYRKRSVLVFLHFPGGEITQSDSPAPPPPWHLSTMAPPPPWRGSLSWFSLGWWGWMRLEPVGN